MFFSWLHANSNTTPYYYYVHICPGIFSESRESRRIVYSHFVAHRRKKNRLFASVLPDIVTAMHPNIALTWIPFPPHSPGRCTVTLLRASDTTLTTSSHTCRKPRGSSENWKDSCHSTPRHSHRGKPRSSWLNHSQPSVTWVRPGVVFQ